MHFLKINVSLDLIVLNSDVGLFVHLLMVHIIVVVEMVSLYQFA